VNTSHAGRVYREKRASLVVLAVLALANAAFFGGVVYPLQSRVASADQRAAAAATELAAAEREHGLASETLLGKEKAQVELMRFYEEILPSNQSAARRITYLRLAELAREADLAFDQRTFSVADLRESSLNRLDITMLLTGPYDSVRQFIHELEETQEFIVITGVELVQRRTNDSALELTLRLATYYRTADDGQ
jgi:hypothetical protein